MVEVAASKKVSGVFCAMVQGVACPKVADPGTKASYWKTGEPSYLGP